MRKNQYILVFIVIITLIVIVSCSKKDSKQFSENITEDIPIISTDMEEVEEEVIIEEEPENHDNETRSKLTGLWIDKEVANQRPYAIMFNNIKLASPQSGTSEADILYEAIVEGGITRLMGIFEQAKSERIGSIRSARHYFVSFADEYDAIFVHFGETKYATNKIATLGINNLSGLTGIGNTVFYRDKSIKAPHNAFTSINGIEKGMKSKKYRTEYHEDHKDHFKFYEKDTELKSDIEATHVLLNFSTYTSPYFVYQEEEKVYERYQFGVPHKDRNNDQQLAFKNIIIQYVKEWNIDKNGYQTMDIEDATGEGYYISNGKVINITWRKNERTKEMRYYNSNDKELKINSGKTYIGIFPDNRKEDVVFSIK